MSKNRAKGHRLDDVRRVHAVLIGGFHIFAGSSGSSTTRSTRPPVRVAVRRDDGWIHLIGGIVILLAGFSILSGAVWARTVGVIVALISAFTSFAWLPWYPIWGIMIIAIDVTVIWALTAHGRDIVTEG